MNDLLNTYKEINKQIIVELQKYKIELAKVKKENIIIKQELINNIQIRQIKSIITGCITKCTENYNNVIPLLLENNLINDNVNVRTSLDAIRDTQELITSTTTITKLNPNDCSNTIMDKENYPAGSQKLYNRSRISYSKNDTNDYPNVDYDINRECFIQINRPRYKRNFAETECDEVSGTSPRNNLTRLEEKNLCLSTIQEQSDLLNSQNDLGQLPSKIYGFELTLNVPDSSKIVTSTPVKDQSEKQNSTPVKSKIENRISTPMNKRKVNRRKAAPTILKEVNIKCKLRRP